MTDSIQRFVFEDAPVRGQLVQLDATWKAVLQRHDYPAAVSAVLGELMAASALLADTVKFSGALVMQLQGQGDLQLMVAECTSELGMRATAQWQDSLQGGSLKQMLGDGRFAITLMPGAAAQQSYQGIVALDGETLAEMLQHYMHRSEQIDTRFWLAADGSRAAGLLLQRLPGEPEADDTWDRARHLSATLTRDELLALPASEIIRRLYHEVDVRVFRPHPLRFACSCSAERAASTLRMLGREEVRSIIAECGSVEIRCEFCNARYSFDPLEAETLFVDACAAPSATRH